VVGADVTIFTTIFQGFGYLLAMGLANLFYYLGPGMERFVVPAFRATYRRWVFRAGLFFSVALPFMVPLVVLIGGCAPDREP
jgi:hypothetical protein